jgi:hypothetical protein
MGSENYRPRWENALLKTIGFSETTKRGNMKIFDMICYCFGYTREAIEQDVLENGRSIITEKIIAEKRFGTCQCPTKNPKGR